MKEAIANAGVFNLIIIFVIILILMFIGSLSYSRGFKAKNKIIEEIEKDQGFTASTQERIDDWLSNIGYRANVGYNKNSDVCAKTVSGNGGRGGNLVNEASDYQYCVYEFDTCGSGSDTAKCGKYYRVITYMYFDIPVIGGLLKLPVNGETMIFNEINR